MVDWEHADSFQASLPPPGVVNSTSGDLGQSALPHRAPPTARTGQVRIKGLHSRAGLDSTRLQAASQLAPNVVARVSTYREHTPSTCAAHTGWQTDFKMHQSAMACQTLAVGHVVRSGIARYFPLCWVGHTGRFPSLLSLLLSS